MAEATLSTPALASLSPDTAFVTDGKLALAIFGSGFTMNSTVYYGDAPQPTAMLAPDLLSAPLDPALYEPSTIEVTVKTGDHVTAALPLTLKEKQDGESEDNPP